MRRDRQKPNTVLYADLDLHAQPRICIFPHKSKIQPSNHTGIAMSAATLVIGATGATGRHVVQQLLDRDRPVRVIVRSKERMLKALRDPSKANSLLTVKEASLLDLTDVELQNEVDQVDNVVSCLGHNVTLQGIWGNPRRLVTDSVKRITKLMASKPDTSKKFLLMSSDGVCHPGGTDDPRTRTDRFLLFLLRHLVPPHSDNEEAATYLHMNIMDVPWVVIRPTDLIDGDDASEYKLMDKPPGGLFGDGVATRANVAKCMVDMITNDKLFEDFKMGMPVLHDAHP